MELERVGKEVLVTEGFLLLSQSHPVAVVEFVGEMRGLD
jgi:hypothetical protein